MKTRWAALSIALSLGCAGSGGSSAETAIPDTAGLDVSLQVRVTEDSVRLNLYVANSSADPVVLEFADAQRYDFAVETTDGDEVWRWSEDRMFAQVTGTETLAPGETLQYGESWMPGDRRGVLIAVGAVTAAPKIERRMQFQIP